MQVRQQLMYIELRLSVRCPAFDQLRNAFNAVIGPMCLWVMDKLAQLPQGGVGDKQ
jgi:hypothetical protein